jgi:hypothetical protein
MKKIRIVAELKKQIAKELGVTIQTVENNLSYFYDSQTAKDVRRRAKELLQEEANNVKIEINTNINN